MVVIGIECTAHTFGVGVVNKGKILANVKDMYLPKKGGIIPMESAKHHREVANRVWDEALGEAKIVEEDIDSIAVSNAPGLAPCLIEGLKFAKAKAKELNVPLIGVNHCIAHLEIGRSAGAVDPVLLYASGANTQIIAFTTDDERPRMPSSSKNGQKLNGTAGKYRVFGETLDSGIGNFIDTFARHCGIPFPGGPEMEKIASLSNHRVINGKSKGVVHDGRLGHKPTQILNGNRCLVELPYSIKGMDVSFSGMQTKLKQLYDKGIDLGDLAYSMQEHAFAMLVEAAERALAHTGKGELVLGGGVACNKRFQEMCKIMCKARGAKFFCPEKSLLVDNGAMIAFTGELIIDGKRNNGKMNHKDGDIEKVLYRESDIDGLDISPRERTDEVDVSWR